MNLIVGLAVFVWLLARQLTPRPLQDRSTIQVAMLLVGVVLTADYLKEHGGSTTAIGALAASAVIGAALAYARSWTIRIWSTPHGMMRQGTVLTAVLWVVGLGQHLLVDLVVPDHGLGSASLLAYFGLVLLVQRLTLLHRAGIEGHRPRAGLSSRS